MSAGTRSTSALGDQSDTMVLWPDLRGDLWKKDVYASSNIASQGVSVPRQYTAVVYPAVLTQDAYLTYRIEAPTDITPPRLRRPASQLPDRVVHRLPALVRRRRHLDPLLPAQRRQQAVRRHPLRDRHRDSARRAHCALQVPDSQHEQTATRASGLYSVRMEVDHRPVNPTPRADRRDAAAGRRCAPIARPSRGAIIRGSRVPVQVHRERRRQRSSRHGVADPERRRLGDRFAVSDTATASTRAARNISIRSRRLDTNSRPRACRTPSRGRLQVSSPLPRPATRRS